MTNNVMCVLQKCDNGSNMVKAWGELDGHERAAHNPQLCVNKFMEQPSVMKLQEERTSPDYFIVQPCKILGDIKVDKEHLTKELRKRFYM